MAGETGPVEAPRPLAAAYETPPLTPEQRRRLRRTGITFITICVLLELAVGLGSLGDLRRLSSPTGVAKLWVQAAANRDCDALFDLMRDEAPSDRAGTPGLTYCDAEAARYKGAIVTAVSRVPASLTTPGGVIGRGPIVVEVTQQGAATAAGVVELFLAHTHGRWHVIHEADLSPQG